MVQSSQERGTVSLEKGPEATASLPFPNIHPWFLESVLLAKRMWLKWNYLWIFSHY